MRTSALSSAFVLLAFVAGLAMALPALATVTFAFPDKGNSSWLLAQGLSSAKNATKRAVVGGVVAGSLDAVDDAEDAVASAQSYLDKELGAAGLPTTAALVARAKNATIVPAKAKAASAVQTLRNVTDAIVDGAWDEAQAAESRSRYALAATVASKIAFPSPTTANSSSMYVLPRDKSKEIIAAGKNVSIRARETKRGIEDAAFSADMGKERFSVLVTLDIAYHPQGGDGIDGAQYSSSSGKFPLLSQLSEAKKNAVESFKAAANGSLANASTKTASTAADGGSSSSQATSPSSSSVAASSPPGAVTAITLPVKQVTGAASAYVSFDSAVVAGQPGNTFFSPSAVDPYDVANAVRAMLVSTLRRLASEGNADASALLVLGDESSDGQRTAAPLLSARGVALSAGTGVYVVRVSFPALLPGVPLPLPATTLRSQLMSAVNSVNPSKPCASYVDNTGLDVCDEMNDASHLTIASSRLLAIEAAPANAVGDAAQLPFGRRSKLDMEAQQFRLSSAAVVYAEQEIYAPAKAPGPPPQGDYVTKMFDSVGKVLGKDSPVGKFFESAGATLGFVSAGWSLVSSILNIGEPSEAETTKNYLNEINATTYKILDGVYRIENTLQHIEAEIDTLGSQIKTQLSALRNQILFAECSRGFDVADLLIDKINARWLDYNKQTLDGPRFALLDALTRISQKKQPRKQPAEVFEPWVQKVLADGNFGGKESLEVVLNLLHKKLVRPDGVVPSVINACAVSSMANWRSKVLDEPQKVFSFDDRQYFMDIQNLLRYYHIWTARGLQMLQEAWLFRAQAAALKAWAANQAVPGCDTTSPSVDRSKCILNAEQLPLAGPLVCVRLRAAQERLPANFVDALTACDNLELVTKTIVNNVYTQQEIAGVPYSWGGPGEGVRLVLGSDVTGVNATVGFFGGPFITPAGDINQRTKTEWLVPASVSAFDPNCIDGFRPCPTLSGFKDDTYFRFQRSSRSSFRYSYPLNYAAMLWQPADGTVWNLGLRGMMFPEADPRKAASEMRPRYKTDFLHAMEMGAESFGAVPFTGIYRDSETQYQEAWWVKDVACRDERGAAITPFLELCYYDKTYPLGLNGTLLSPRNLEKKADRLPALRLTDIPDRGDKCTASWDSSVPVRCGSDKTRFLVAKLGARGLSDTESWPALDANNQTATTAIVELFQEGGEARVRCTPRWIRRDGTAPGVLGVKTLPASQSVLVTQSAGPVYDGEAPLAFASKTEDFYEDQAIPLASVSFSNTFQANSSSPTGYERYLPRVITCVIRANDPGNNGLPVYATGQYIALANSSSPFGIELRPNFSFPL